MKYILTEQQVENLQNNIDMLQQASKVMVPTKEFNEKIKPILDYINEFTYAEKLKLVFSIIPWKDFDSYTYREKVAKEFLKQYAKDNNLEYIDREKGTENLRHGSDLPGYSLKSGSAKPLSKTTGRFEYTASDRIGTWSSPHLSGSTELERTFADVWDETEVIMRIQIEKTSEFEKLYNDIGTEVRSQFKTGLENKSTIRHIKIRDLICYGVPYQIIAYSKEKVTLSPELEMCQGRDKNPCECKEYIENESKKDWKKFIGKNIYYKNGEPIINSKGLPRECKCGTPGK